MASRIGSMASPCHPDRQMGDRSPDRSPDPAGVREVDDGRWLVTNVCVATPTVKDLNGEFGKTGKINRVFQWLASMGCS